MNRFDWEEIKWRKIHDQESKLADLNEALRTCSEEDYADIALDIHELEQQLKAEREESYYEARADYLYERWKGNR